MIFFGYSRGFLAFLAILTPQGLETPVNANNNGRSDRKFYVLKFYVPFLLPKGLFLRRRS